MRNFFEHQDHALAKSAKLIGLLVLATSGTVCLTGLVLTYLFVLVLVGLSQDVSAFKLQLAEIFSIISVMAAGLMAVSSLHKMKQLKAGGKVIAHDLGGVLIESGRSDRRGRRVLNVVEEMALASGIPVPAVYMLPNQRGINAFAAGLTFDDAVIGVTQGCLERLNRQQLQGVIAHEFSHILNGDMRLNLRLVGVLHGLLGISLFAEAMLQTAQQLASDADPHRDAATEMALALLMALAGLMLWPVGLIGTLFGMMVMSATSRQREYLADAYAVQFTRNPDGLAGALKVLIGCDAGSRVRCAKSLEASHFFFASGTRWTLGIMATHPPLDERILRLDPQWDGLPLFEDDDDGEEDESDERSRAETRFTEGADDPKSATKGASTAGLASVPLASVVAPLAAATTTARSQDQSLFTSADVPVVARHQLLESLPSGWIDFVQDPDGCQAILLAIWMSTTGDREASFARIDGFEKQIGTHLLNEVLQMDDAHQTLLFDLAINHLDTLTSSNLSRFQRQVQQLHDGLAGCDIVAWSIGWQLRRRLQIVPKTTPRPRYGKLTDIQSACEVLMSALCLVGTDHEAMAQYAFQRSVVHLQLRDPEFWTRDELSCERLDAAVQLMAEAAPRPRRHFLQGIERSVSADLSVTSAEVHFVRGFCAALNVSTPDLFPGQAVTPGS